MKPLHPRLLLVLLAVGLAASPLLAQTDWVQQLPKPTPTLRGLHVQSALVAWTAGGAGIVRGTQDGGLTWQEQQLPTSRLDAVRFASSAIGLAVGDGIFRTANAGTSWTQVNGTSGLHDVVYVTSSLAIACGEGGRLLRSTDGGATWSLQALPGAGSLLALSFGSASNGLVVGAGGEAFRTTDGGLTWQPLATGTTQDLTDVDLVSASEGWVSAGDRLLHTTDLGQTWQSQPLPAGFTALGVDFVVPSHGWVSGEDEWAAYTTDGGQTWTTGLTGSGGALLAIGFANFSKGLAVGENGRIHTSENGGQSWTLVAGGSSGVGVPPFLEAFSAVDSLHAWGIGGAGRVFRTADGGAEWSEGLIDPQSVYRDIDFHDSQFGTVGGNRQGTFPGWGWTTDGGQTWNSGHMTAQWNVYTAESFGPGRALVAGSFWILRTTNYWQSFSMSSPEPLGTYHGSDSIGDTIWLVGTKFMRSQDGGTTWQFLHDPGPTFRAVSFADTQNGWAVGDGGAILFTTNGGAAWQSASLPPGSPGLRAVHAVSPLHVWIAGDSDYLAQTLNGGAQWTVHQLPKPTVDNYSGVRFLEDGGAWLAGGSYSTGGKVWRAGPGPEGCEVISYCSAKINSQGGAALLWASGNPSLASADFEVHVQGALPSQFGLLFHSEAGPDNSPFMGGTLCAALPLVRLGVEQLDAAGAVSYPIAVTSGMPGLNRWYQFWYRDSLHPDGSAVGLSNGLQVRFCP